MQVGQCSNQEADAEFLPKAQGDPRHRFKG
jgi:hypothetical protein